MSSQQTGRGRCRGRPADIDRASGSHADFDHDLFDHTVGEEPRPHVLRLLLTPDDLRLREPLELPEQRLVREGINLFEPYQVNVPDASFGPLLVKIVIDLAAAQHDAPDRS